MVVSAAFSGCLALATTLALCPGSEAQYFNATDSTSGNTRISAYSGDHSSVLSQDVSAANDPYASPSAAPVDSSTPMGSAMDTSPVQLDPAPAATAKLQPKTAAALEPMPQAEVKQALQKTASPLAGPSKPATTDAIGLRTKPVGNAEPKDGKLEIEVQDTTTGQMMHVEVSSEELTYDTVTGKYNLDGDVYIIVPEKDIEILSEEAVFDMDKGTLDAYGNVFIFNKEQVTGGTQARYDTDHSALYQKDFRTKTRDYELQAEKSERYDHFQVLTNGRIITDASPLLSHNDFQWMLLGDGASYSFYTARLKDMYMSGDINRIGLSGPNLLADQGHGIDDPRTGITIPDKTISPADVAAVDFDRVDRKQRIRVKTIKMHQYKGNIDEVRFSHPRVRVGGIPMAYLPYAKFGHNRDEGLTAFLGPDIGYDIDYGGAYFGPSFSRRLGDGFGYISPIVTFGEGRRPGQSVAAFDVVDPQVGAGVLAHYRSRRHYADVGWNSTLADFTALTSTRLFKHNPATRLRVGWNTDYRNGFFGDERPNLAAEITDQRNFSMGNFLLQTYASGGGVRDEFFPTGRRTFFVAPTGNEPRATGRLQGQAQLLNVRPLFTIADNVAFNVLAQARVAAYATGDFFGVFRAGPRMTFAAGPFFSNLQYLFTETTGSTPFVFDAYYEGSHNLQNVTSIDLGKHVTVGALHNFNLTSDNARNDLLVGRQFFLSFGPESVKFSIGYDIIQKQSLIGITINPQGGDTTIDYNTFNMYGSNYSSSHDHRIPFSFDTVAPRKKSTTQPPPAPPSTPSPAPDSPASES
ncbi:MAG: hypothetical protein R2857_04000 [Vampirovibrionales bacterium]